jgi:hypothetical protein
MDSILKAVGETLNVVGKVIIPQPQAKKEPTPIQPTTQTSQLRVAGIGFNNNLKPKGVEASVGSSGMF